MSKVRPTPVTGSRGSCAVGTTAATCCLAHGATHEVTGSFGRIFRQYGRSTSWFRNLAAARANLPAGVTWENYYYRDSYAYQLKYAASASTNGRANGTIKVKIHARATVHAVPATLTRAAPTLFTTVTPAVITTAFTSWNAAVQTHWTGHHTVLLGAPKCPGRYPISFSVVQKTPTTRGAVHVTFSVLNMQHPRNHPRFGPALTNPASPLYATAQSLSREWRSHAGKFNLGDGRGTLVFAHEYGHWIGWGDEYIEVSGTIPHPTNPRGGTVASETRGGTNRSLRVAVRITNPTQVFQRARGSNLEVVDLTGSGRANWLMGSMGSPQTYPSRFVYTIVDDFIRLYNRDNYGGARTAFCINVI